MRLVVEQSQPSGQWLGDIDLLTLGARSGLLWRGLDTTLAGVGDVHRLPVSRPDGAAAAQEALEAFCGEPSESAGPPHAGFASFAFDLDEPGELLVPEVLVGERVVDGKTYRWMSVLAASSSKGAQRAISELITNIEPLEQTEPTGRWIEVHDRIPAPQWMDLVSEARDAINRGELEKVVLARQVELKASGLFSTPAIVTDLAQRFPAAMVFSVDGFVGASPELLVARRGRSLSSHPLAGTLPRTEPSHESAAVAAEVLLGSAKDRNEHRITINWLLEELLPFCSYVDAEPEPSVMELANVYHLGTRVQGVATDPPASILSLVGAVHPTPAVGGSPRQLALEAIDRVEGFERERYAGPTGWVDTDGNGSFAVSVRTAQIVGSVATVCAGVGVVAESDPAAELAETQAKFQAILPTLFNPAMVVSAC